MSALVNFFEALNRLPIGEKMSVTIEPVGSRNSGTNLIGELVRNPHGFAFLETDISPIQKFVDRVSSSDRRSTKSKKKDR